MEYTVNTAFGKFRVKKNDTLLSVGGRRFCVQVVYKGINGEDSELSWLNTNKGGCELEERRISGDTTVQMVHLAIDLLRRDYPHLRKIHLLDSSAFNCKLPDGSLRHVSMMKSHFLFHGQTYYEKRFGAYPRYESAQSMEAFRKGWVDPTKKPEMIDFNNKDLNRILAPLYADSATWVEFFQKIQEKYGSDKCTIIYPWYLHILNRLSPSEMPAWWTIDLGQIPPVETKLAGGGSKKYNRATKKRARAIQYIPPQEYFWDGYGIYDMSYASYS